MLALIIQHSPQVYTLLNSSQMLMFGHSNVLFTFCQTGVLGIMSEAVFSVAPGVWLMLPDQAVTPGPRVILGPGQEHRDGPGGGPRRPGGEHPGGGEVRHAVTSLGPQPRLV